MAAIDDDEPVFDATYLRTLLTEVRPDMSLDDFRHYCDFDDALFADLLAEVLNLGEAAIYRDEFNTPIICLTALGADRAGVKLSQSWPSIWLRVDGYEPPIFAVQDEGFVLFTDLGVETGSGDIIEFVATQVDEKQLEPVEVLTNVEDFSEWLLLDRFLPNGQLIPHKNDFLLYGFGRIWPRMQDKPATRTTPSATTHQMTFTQCPFCRNAKDRSQCGACGGHAPGRPCPDCDGIRMSFHGYCAWCERSGLDHVLPTATVAEARRKPRKKK